MKLFSGILALCAVMVIFIATVKADECKCPNGSRCCGNSSHEGFEKAFKDDGTD
ncbi:uncharacterized protein UHO2_04012 [Ustilago hordei]|uniref:Uncharacterized protein n=1 Tax=Ustilago hordei TaxID=120017 RepID=I2FQ38_USTHO|nr:uncharacterized protein UHO2_04012 [Ustilago hordei]CCF49031.1 uncharacterized protein UHOR_13509 [Ustilago hordei]SYW86514.1 uncharacterized protein UHO2_04012 [Ustilago hordei]